jgi:hypothetical protein
VSLALVERRALMRVFAVTHRRGQLAAEGAPARRLDAKLRRHPVGDRRVVGGGAGEGLLRQPAPQRLRDLAGVLLNVGQHGRIVRGVDDDRHIAMVLGGGADHRRAADVDVFDAVGVALSGGHRLLEGVEIDHQQVDRADAVRQHRGLMLRVGAHRQQAAMHARMQRLDASVHHLGKAGQIRDIANREPRLRQRRAGAAGRNQFDAAPGQCAGEVDQSGLVGHRQQGARDPARFSRHVGRSPWMARGARAQPSSEARYHAAAREASGNSGCPQKAALTPTWPVWRTWPEVPIEAR